MAWSRTLECPDCSHQWPFLAMTKAERNPPCPMCAAKPIVPLTAPRLNVGAPPVNRITVPSNKTKATDMAMRMISEQNGGQNMKSTSRPGEAVAMPIPTDVAWGGNVKQGPPITYDSAISMAASDPTRGRNVGMMDALTDKQSPFTKPVYRTPRFG